MMTISTSLYEFTHGRSPRGRGHWAFEFKCGSEWEVYFAPGEMLFSRACTWAREQVDPLCATAIRVAP